MSKVNITVSQVRKQLKERRRTRVESLRIEANLGVRELAHYSGVSPATISHVEAGKEPSLRTAMRLARFFETSVEDLFAEFLK